MTHLLDQLLNVPPWVLLSVVGALVFAEDALFVGFVLPAETAAVLAGVSAHFGHVSLTAVIVTVVAAAVIGDSVGFEVGRHFGARLLAWRRLDRHRDRLVSAQDLLSRRGGVAVFLGRFVAFLRAVMPALAGSARMPYRTFLLFNALGGLVWGVGVVVLGYVAGASYAKVEQQVGTGVAIAVAAVAILAVVAWQWQRRRRERDADEPRPT